MRTFRLLLTVLILAVTNAGHAETSCSVDSDQAVALVRLMKSCRSGPCSGELLETFLRSRGTELIVAQQNVSRRVAPAEYREAIDAALHERAPDLQASVEDRRSERGIEGLRNDVVPAMTWALTQIDLLEKRVAAIAELHVCERATVLAATHLPSRRAPRAKMFVVMGGRAGAAAAADEIYFDVLATSYRAATGRGDYPSDDEIVAYFAHELHHVGYGQYLRSRRERLPTLSESEAAAYSLVESALMEGSATYLINWRRDIRAMKNDRTFDEVADRVDSLIERLDDVLTAAMRDALSRDQLDATAPEFSGNALHALGATMLATIDRVYGDCGIDQVMREPRQFLVTYNAAIARSDGTTRSFDAETAEHLVDLGRR